MNRNLLLLIAVATLSACGPQSVRHSEPSLRRLSFVESVSVLPDGSRDIVVSGDFSSLPSGGKVQSVDLGERLEQAAKAECKGRPYELIPSKSMGNASSKSKGLKFTLKGNVRCAME